jgi:hypothetical protein
MVCWLFFNFAMPFDFRCCSLAQEMSFVDGYLPYFRQQLITHWPSALLSFQPLFTESSHWDQLLTLPLFSGVLSATLSLCCVLILSSLFIVQFVFWGGGQSAQGAMLVYPRAGCGKTMWCGAHLLVCLMSHVWSQHLEARQPSCFLSVTWYGDTFHGLWVQDVKVLILLAVLFLPSVAPASQWGFGFSELMLSSAP